ncbi:hypothetical protein [Agromyces archimandritae]|uniref:ABM domain-containing protein n=1 Tax=Agromyces archimandritae TaxID=2781962 RepID=A0A975FPB2_9MICO|nr:hypothetical protein [Agromyces archimandritae]QTX05342.1 hypothetical protein G127AT_03700 [Agromyces archimandritae]
MFMQMTIYTPKPEFLGEVIASMNRVRLAGLGTPGLDAIGPWREADGGRAVGIALWESRRHFEEHAEAVFAVADDDPFERWLAAPPERILLDDVGAAPGNPEEW